MPCVGGSNPSRPALLLYQSVGTLAPSGGEGDKFDALYVLAGTTRMRQGELLGLKWDDIDLDEGTLRVRRSPMR